MPNSNLSENISEILKSLWASPQSPACKDHLIPSMSAALENTLRPSSIISFSKGPKNWESVGWGTIQRNQAIGRYTLLIMRMECVGLCKTLHRMEMEEEAFELCGQHNVLTRKQSERSDGRALQRVICIWLKGTVREVLIYCNCKEKHWRFGRSGWGWRGLYSTI